MCSSDLAHDLVVEDVDTDLREAFRQPLGIRVGDLPEQEFRADGDDFRAHQAEGDGGSGDPDGSALTEGPALDGAPSDGVGVGDSSASPGTNV